jgi:hypothetical protein
MISSEAAKKILGITEVTPLAPEEMAKTLVVTFFPSDLKHAEHIESFIKDFRAVLDDLGVKILPYEKTIHVVPVHKVLKRISLIIINNLAYGITRLFTTPNRLWIEWGVVKNALNRKRVTPGVSVIAVGDSKTGNLPMDNNASFTRSSVITILDLPDGIDENSDFQVHFDLAMNLFAYHMTNIVLLVGKEKWIVYNFNASHPVYSRSSGFKKNVLHAVVPKIAAPIKPHKFSEFIVSKHQFDPHDFLHRPITDDLIQGALMFGKTNLYPRGKNISLLPFRNDYYRWIGKIHLDNRNGMSYGFLAHQMPIKTNVPRRIDDNSSHLLEYFFDNNGNLNIIFAIHDQKYSLVVPEVWVLSQRSGSDKTNVNPNKDLLKIGLKNGKMLIESPEGLILKGDYKPSFDTKVILAHAVGNAIITSISEFLTINNDFVDRAKKTGLAICHWHGYFNPERIPGGIVAYGHGNPHVACSSPQSAIYALNGKLQAFINTVLMKQVFNGDIHVEPHHGTNVTYSSILDLSEYIINNPDSTTLGNKYLSLYN